MFSVLEFWWCLKRRGPEMCTFGVLGLSCASPGGPVWWGRRDLFRVCSCFFCFGICVRPFFCVIFLHLSCSSFSVFIFFCVRHGFFFTFFHVLFFHVLCLRDFSFVFFVIYVRTCSKSASVFLCTDVKVVSVARQRICFYHDWLSQPL